jgi:hypothetical protein
MAKILGIINSTRDTNSFNSYMVYSNLISSVKSMSAKL